MKETYKISKFKPTQGFLWGYVKITVFQNNALKSNKYYSNNDFPQTNTLFVMGTRNQFVTGWKKGKEMKNVIIVIHNWRG